MSLSDRERAEGFHLSITTSVVELATTQNVPLTKNLHCTTPQPQATHLPNRLRSSLTPFAPVLIPRASVSG